MNKIQSETKLPYLERNGSTFHLNVNQREVTVKEGESEKTVFEIYQETFQRIPTIREKLNAVKSAVRMYASTLKQFTLGTSLGWLDSDTRASIKDAVEATKESGASTYTMWMNGKPYTLSCDKVLEILSAIELYSSQCNDITSKYLSETERCGADVEKACGIDFTQGYPEKPTFEATDDYSLNDEQKLTMAKDKKLAEIDAYDSSSEVNSFSFGGQPMWFSHSERMGIKDSIKEAQNAGKETYTVWFGNYAPMEIPCDTALSLFTGLEAYAMECYNVTAKHKMAVNALETIKEVEAYDYKTGYPEKLTVTL